jgi:hypothetical protein
VTDASPVVLVGGSRILTRRRDGHAWALDVLRAQITPAAVLVTGDARGPDAWAVEVAREVGASWRSYALDGFVYGPGGVCRDADERPVRWTTRTPPPPWSERLTDAEKRARKAWCLYRDRVMVEHCAKALRSGRRVTMVACIDLDSATQGTDYTAGVARSLGLEVARYQYPNTTPDADAPPYTGTA